MYTEKINIMNEDPNQHSSRKTKYQHQTFKKSGGSGQQSEQDS